MTKHTAAPWHIGTPPPNGEQTIGAQNGMMVAIATTGVGMKEETLANARLIAAAPELLKALKGIVAFCDEDMQHRVQTSREYDIKTLAQTAIAKAEGQA
jgi:hypothetical protein